jgi:hypothetical protein
MTILMLLVFYYKNTHCIEVDEDFSLAEISRGNSVQRMKKIRVTKSGKPARWDISASINPV